MIPINRDGRCEPEPEDSFPVDSIELAFSIPCFITQEDQAALHLLMERIVRRPCNQTKEGVHWVSGTGSKPQWSKLDAAFLGRPAELGAPDSGGPSFDDSILFFETTTRGFISDEERARTELSRSEPVINWTPYSEGNGFNPNYGG